MGVQVFDEDGKRKDLISEGEVDLIEVIKNGEQDGNRLWKRTSRRQC